MKKLMIMAASLAMASAVFASDYKWGFQTAGIINATGTAENEDYLMAGTAFLYLGTVSASSSAFDFSKATYITMTDGLDPDEMTWGPINTVLSSTDVTSTAAGQAFSLILVDQEGLSSADLASYKGNYVLYNGTSGAPSPIVVPGKETTYAASFFDTTGNNYEGQWSSMSTATPEPTSGLLLLIGMAGLALRRRRA